MKGELFASWHAAFVEVIRTSAIGEPLREASLAADLKAWTESLTTSVVQSCSKIGLIAAGKSHQLDLLPKQGQEYLSLDVMGFDQQAAHGRWPMPTAIFELENDKKDDRVAYSLWKVLCVKARLRVVFAFRPNWEAGRSSVAAIGDDVINSLSQLQVDDIRGDTAIIFGNRGEGEHFPDGFFKCYLLDTELKKFIKA